MLTSEGTACEKSANARTHLMVRDGSGCHPDVLTRNQHVNTSRRWCDHLSRPTSIIGLRVLIMQKAGTSKKESVAQEWANLPNSPPLGEAWLGALLGTRQVW